MPACVGYYEGGQGGMKPNQCDPHVLTALCVANPKAKNSNASGAETASASE